MYMDKNWGFLSPIRPSNQMPQNSLFTYPWMAARVTHIWGLYILLKTKNSFCIQTWHVLIFPVRSTATASASSTYTLKKSATE